MAPSLFSPFAVLMTIGCAWALSKKYGGRKSVKHKADKRLSFDLSELLSYWVGE